MLVTAATRVEGGAQLSKGAIAGVAVAGALRACEVFLRAACICCCAMG